MVQSLKAESAELRRQNRVLLERSETAVSQAHELQLTVEKILKVFFYNLRFCSGEPNFFSTSSLLPSTLRSLLKHN
jgi:hypothetical protein